MHSSTCALCGEHPRSEECFSSRKLVPDILFRRKAFDIDPLGTARAQVALCPGCQNVLAAPMLLTEDVTRFAEIMALHQEQFAAPGARIDEGARARLFHRALHLGLRALLGELSEKPQLLAQRPEADQLDLFSSNLARFAEVEEALEAGDFVRARTLARELFAKHGLSGARYLARRLGTIEQALVEAAGQPDELKRIGDRARSLLEGEKLPRGLVDAFERGLRRRAG